MVTGHALGFLDRARAPAPNVCSVSGCGLDRAPGSQWCPDHKAAFLARCRGEDTAPRLPSYWRRTPAPAPIPVSAPDPAPAVVDVPAPAPPKARRKPGPKVRTGCSVDGCDAPRLAGYWMCADHQRAYWRQQEARRAARAKAAPADRPPSPRKQTTCCEPGCTEPRHKDYHRCHAHQKACWRQAAERQKAREAAKVRELQRERLCGILSSPQITTPPVLEAPNGVSPTREG